MTKEELYCRFGPKLIEAIVYVLVYEINKLKKEQGVAEITEQFFMDSVSEKLNSIPDYNWMNEGL